MTLKMYISNICIAKRIISGETIEDKQKDLNEAVYDMYKLYYESLIIYYDEPVFYIFHESRMNDIKEHQLPTWEDLREEFKSRLIGLLD